jgi:putative peptide maturation system protein
MDEELAARLAAVHALLARLQRDESRPEEAQRLLGEARPSFGGWDLQLIWTEEPYDRSLHYDAIVTSPAGAAFSVSRAVDRGIPWALRAVVHSGDGVVVVAGGVSVKFADVAADLTSVWSDPMSQARLVDAALVRAATAGDPPVADDAAVATRRDELARRRGLLDAAAIAEWCASYALPPDVLERFAREQIAAGALQERLVGEAIEAHFEGHRPDYDRVSLCRVTAPDRSLERLASGDLAAAAERLLAADPACGLVVSFARSWRFELPAAIAGGTRLGPTRRGHLHEVSQVREIRPATLDPSTRQAVRERLFAGWLAERRAAARVRWNWTAPAGDPGGGQSY